MNKGIFTVLAIISLLFAIPLWHHAGEITFAAERGGPRGGGGHYEGGGHHGGEGYHGWEGHHGHGPFWGGKVVVRPWYPYGSWWYPYSPWYPYGAWAYPYPYSYGGPPVVIQQQPPVYFQKDQPESREEQESNYWYYCQDPQGYYPYVKSCPGGWMKVVPQTPNE